MDGMATSHEAWAAEMLRVGNRAVRQAQALNRALGIANWYSINGRLVSDTGEVRVLPVVDEPSHETRQRTEPRADPPGNV